MINHARFGNSAIEGRSRPLFMVYCQQILAIHKNSVLGWRGSITAILYLIPIPFTIEALEGIVEARWYSYYYYFFYHFLARMWNVFHISFHLVLVARLTSWSFGFGWLEFGWKDSENSKQKALGCRGGHSVYHLDNHGFTYDALASEYL